MPAPVQENGDDEASVHAFSQTKNGVQQRNEGYGKNRIHLYGMGPKEDIVKNVPIKLFSNVQP